MSFKTCYSKNYFPFIFLSTNCFDENTLRDWQRFLRNSVSSPTKDDLKKFVESQIIYLEVLESNFNTSNYQKKHSRTANTQGKYSSSNSHQTNESKDGTKNTRSCTFCAQDLLIAKCNKFQELSQSFDNPERGQFVEANKLCIGRHENPHECKSKNSCSTCKRAHHTLLHYRRHQNSAESSSTDSHDEAKSSLKESSSCRNPP